MLGVKNKHGALPAESYFKEKMIASQPVDFNVHSSNTWDLKDLTQTVFDMLCGPLPTASPTRKLRLISRPTLNLIYLELHRNSSN